MASEIIGLVRVHGRARVIYRCASILKDSQLWQLPPANADKISQSESSGRLAMLPISFRSDRASWHTYGPKACWCFPLRSLGRRSDFIQMKCARGRARAVRRRMSGRRRNCVTPIYSIGKTSRLRSGVVFLEIGSITPGIKVHRWQTYLSRRSILRFPRAPR